MSGLLGTIPLWALAASFHALGVSGLVGILWPTIRARVAALPPASRARALLGVAVAPVVVGAFLATLCFVPSAMNQVGLGVDHCVDHGHHPHLCIVHGRAEVSAAIAAALGVLGLACLAGVAVRIAAARRTHRWLGALSSTAADGVRVVKTELPIAVTTGLWRPRVVLSSGLLSALGKDDVATVLAHERAHASRRDGLVALVASGLSPLHLPWVRRSVMRDLALACEQACDEEAAVRIGDRLQVASAIVTVERLLAKAPPLAASAFHAAKAVHRVEALLGSPPPVPNRRRRTWRLALALGALGILADPLHHATETLLAIVAR